jgi:hypothetical protein
MNPGDRNLPKLARARMVAKLDPASCLSDGGSTWQPDLGSPGFASVCHLPVRVRCEVSA